MFRPKACLLLSLESVYPAAYQLAVDMLKRIANANEEIVEILLSKNKVLSALRYLCNSCYTNPLHINDYIYSGSLGIRFQLKAFLPVSFLRRPKTPRIHPSFSGSINTFNSETGALEEVPLS